jgi:hypothetical protein
MTQLRDSTPGVVGEAVDDHCSAAGTIPFKPNSLNAHVGGGGVDKRFDIFPSLNGRDSPKAMNPRSQSVRRSDRGIVSIRR